jgi:hypothetical protein
MLNFFSKKYTITLISEKWERLENNIKMTNVPRYSEFIFLKKKNIYYKVENVIYSIDKKNDIFIVVKIFQQKNLIK